MKAKRAGIFLFLLLITALAFYLYRSNRSKDEPEYRTAQVERSSLVTSVLSTGIVQPENRVEVKPPIAGRAEEVLVREGDRVAKGQTLVWMSSTERAALLDAARARGAEELQNWEQLYRPTPILAPIQGTIILRSIEAGQTFTTTDPILVMSDRLTIQAQVDETDLAQIRVKQKSTIVLDAYPQDRIPGHVEKIAYEAKTVNNVTTYIVTVVPEKVPEFMRSGMTANVTFETASRENTLVVPAEALRTRGNEEFVLVSSGDKRKQPLEAVVRSGLSDGKRTEITSGLKEGDTVLISVLKVSADDAKQGSNPFGGPPMGRRRAR